MLNRFKQKNKKNSSKRFNDLLDISIFFSIIYVILAYIKNKSSYLPQATEKQSLKRNTTNKKGKIFNFLGETAINIDRNIRSKKLQYSQSELKEAISELNLPTWSRSYRHCSSSESEIRCHEIIKAWRLIKSWIHSIETTSLENRRYILIQHYFDGVGNRISIDAAGFLLALMDNRSLAIRGFYLKNGQPNYERSNAYHFHPLVLIDNSTFSNDQFFQRDDQSNFYDLQVYKLFWSENFDTLFYTNITINLDHLIYTPVLYAHQITSEFCIEHFGMHAVYFLSNFLIKLPKIHIQKVMQLLNPIPKKILVFGVHLRFQFAGQFYSYSVESTMNKVTPFLKCLQRKTPTIFAFCSDSKDMEREFLRIFNRRNVLMTNAIRIPDFDHDSALLDMALLMACDQCLLSYRSTFSYAVASRTGKRCWFVEKEAPSVFQASNSQAGAISMLMHYYDVNDWQTSRRFCLESENELSFRYYFRYFMF